MDQTEAIDRAHAMLSFRRTFRHDEQILTIALLVRGADWSPLDAPWWRGKEVCIIGADVDGNFFLRHCDGSVRYWDHRLQAETLVAPSVRDFVGRIER